MGKHDEAFGGQLTSKSLIGDEVVDQGTSDTKCGIGPFKPKCLQVFSNMISFSLYYGLSSLISSALTMYLTSQVTTLEKQFGLSSSETGLLLSMNDIGFLALVLFISHFSSNAHKPRILGGCVMLFGISAIISAVPHFVSQEPNVVLSNFTNFSMSTPRPMVLDSFRGESICQTDKFSEEKRMNFTPPSMMTCSKSDQKSHNTGKYVALGIISAGMFLQGVAKSPRMALSQTYIDDNVIKTKTGQYIGIIACLSIFGPATAFAIGAQISRIYVTLEETELSVMDPRWIGAWWLGFLIFGFAALLVSGPLFLFPKYMVIKSKHTEKVRVATKERLQIQTQHVGFLKKLKDMLPTLWGLLTNFTYVCILAAGSVDFFALAGGLSFAPKYFEVFFGLSIFKANMIMGTTTIVAASTGMLAGGLLTTKFKLKLQGCIKFVIVARICSGLVIFIPLFLDCPPQPIVGLTEYGVKGTYGRSAPPVNNSCLTCSCHDSPYFPVCGSDGRSYYSPCVAGCSNKKGYQYSNCSCVLGSEVTGRNVTEDFTATPGLCPNECGLIYVFVVAQILGGFLGTMSAMPQTIAALRSVRAKEKTFSVGLGSFVYSLLGWTLGPVIFGYIIDGTCILWNSSCSKRGSCAIYDVYKMRNTLNLIALGARVICIIIFSICLINLKHRAKTEEDQERGDNADQKKKLNLELEPVRISTL